MPVTLRPWAREGLQANPISGGFTDTGKHLLCRTNDVPTPLELLQCSYGDAELATSIQPTSNGLVHSIIRAYAGHHHLQIRPEDIWLAIISQFSFYVNAHAEELRGKFVAHEGKEELRIDYPCGNRWTMDYSRFATDIAHLLEKNVVDPMLRDWIRPAFSTTTENDTVVASIMMMGVLKNYFSYTCGITCGFPSVTMLGERTDYELILGRLDKLDEYGDEPRRFAALLRPILRRFIRSFDGPDSQEVIEFWHRAFASRNLHPGLCGSVPTYSGWITAFCFWNARGRLLGYEPQAESWNTDGETDEDREVPQESFSYSMDEPYDAREKRYALHKERQERANSNFLRLTLDGIRYHHISCESVPPLQTTVPIKIDDNGEEVMAEIVAGSLGIECSVNTRSEPMASGAIAIDSMQPSTGWWIYEKPPEPDRSGWSIDDLMAEMRAQDEQRYGVRTAASSVTSSGRHENEVDSTEHGSKRDSVSSAATTVNGSSNNSVNGDFSSKTTRAERLDITTGGGRQQDPTALGVTAPMTNKRHGSMLSWASKWPRKLKRSSFTDPEGSG